MRCFQTGKKRCKGLKNSYLELEDRCSIQLSYGHKCAPITLAPAHARMSRVLGFRASREWSRQRPVVHDLSTASRSSLSSEDVFAPMEEFFAATAAARSVERLQEARSDVPQGKGLRGTVASLSSRTPEGTPHAWGGGKSSLRDRVHVLSNSMRGWRTYAYCKRLTALIGNTAASLYSIAKLDDEPPLLALLI